MLKIDFQWREQLRGSALERATFADLTVSVNEFVATELDDLLARTTRKAAHLGAYHLARWLAGNWWRLRWEPERQDSIGYRMSHYLAAAGEGFVWPDVRFFSDGETVVIHGRPTQASGVAPIRYLNEFDTSTTASEFERAIDEFISAVVTRLDATGHADNDLRQLWLEVLSERKDPESTEWRRLEALLGYDPDEAPTALMESLTRSAGDVGADALREVAAAARENTQDQLGKLRDAAATATVTARVPDLAKLAAAAQPTSADEFPWQRAARTAAEARAAWGLNLHPIDDAALARIFDVPTGFVSNADACTSPLSAGFREHESDCFKVAINKRPRTSRRFALARLAGDSVIAARPDRLLPVTDAGTARQKFQRAFAQELLCPFNAIKQHIGSGEPTDSRMEDIAEEFSVSPLLVRTTLVNHHRLDRGALDQAA